MRGADAGRHEHVVVDDPLQRLGRRLPRETGAHECPRRRQIGRAIFAGHGREMIISRPDELRLVVGPRTDVVDAGDARRSIRLEIVLDDAAGIRPADQHGALQAERVHHRFHIVGEQVVLGVALRRCRLVGRAMPAEIERGQAEAAAQLRVIELRLPAFRALREAVDEKDLRSGAVAGFISRELQAVRGRDFRASHVVLPPPVQCSGTGSAAASI